MKALRSLSVLAVVMLAVSTAFAAENPFLGQWSITPAEGGAGWLKVAQENGAFTGILLWMGGSPEVQSRVFFDGDTLYALRVRDQEVKDLSGNVVRTQIDPILLTATLENGVMKGVLSEPSLEGLSVAKHAFTATPVPAPPPTPDLAKVKFGDPVTLFNGKNLDGWVVLGGPHWAEVKDQKPGGGATEGWVPTDPGTTNGWSVKDGVLVNNPEQKEGKPHIHYGNLATIATFEDFNLTLEVSVPPNGNSGVYLRGIYEVQVLDSYGKPKDCHNMGGIYGRIEPLVSAEKPANEWQTLDITLVDRHVTVKLNGQCIVDNQVLDGCTGGALWPDQSVPGPIYLQGDHTGVQYRNIVLRPVTAK